MAGTDGVVESGDAFIIRLTGILNLWRSKIRMFKLFSKHVK